MKYNIVLELENRLEKDLKSEKVVLSNHESKSLEMILKDIDFVPGLRSLRPIIVKDKFRYSGYMTSTKNEKCHLSIIFCETLDEEWNVTDRMMSVFIKTPFGLYAADVEQDTSQKLFRYYYYDEESYESVNHLWTDEDEVDEDTKDFVKLPVFMFEDTAYRFGITPDFDQEYVINTYELDNIFHEINNNIETNKQKVR